MGQKYKADYAKNNPDGSLSWYALWIGGSTLAKVTGCWCEDGKRRAVYTTGEPDTWFSVPASTRVRGHYVKGFLTVDEGNPRFVAQDARRFINRDYAIMLANVRNEAETRRLFPRGHSSFRESRMRRLAFLGYAYGEYPEY